MSDLGIRAGPQLDRDAFEIVRRRLCLHHAKWDPQVGDVSTLADFPLLLRESTWSQLASWAERLAEELLRVERELHSSPSALRRLGLPWRLRRVIAAHDQPPSTMPRVVRFDFHPTASGWRISEANADVPGGFTESSPFTAMMAAHSPHGRPAGDPAAAWAKMIRAVAAGRDGVVALVAAPGFMEDIQVLAGLQPLLESLGQRARLCGPANLRWINSQPSLWNQRVSILVRFVQAEWLPKLTRHWQQWFTTSTPVLNPLTTSVVESKRLPLCWPRLSTPLPTWRQLLPETADPREVNWRDAAWIVKPAYGNTGDDVSSITFTPPEVWKKTIGEVRRHPRDWVAQRRFELLTLDTPAGLRRPCVGVYTIGGKVAGAYGRLSVEPVVDYSAVDAAVLVEADEPLIHLSEP